MKNKRRSTFKKICDYIFYVFFAIVALAVTWVAISMIRGEKPNFFGYRFYAIQTDSMEPTLPVGSIILAHDDADYSKLSKGDIITFKMSNQSKIPNTHRIVGYYYIDINGEYQSDFISSTYFDWYTAHGDGTLIGYRTKGDHYDIDEQPVLFESIESRYIMRILFADQIYSFLMTPYGFILLIALPSLAIIVIQIYNFVQRSKKAKLDDELSRKQAEQDKKIKALQEAAIKEYLASLESNKDDGESGKE